MHYLNAETTGVLLLVLLLQIKHLVADFFLQNAYILDNRRFYGHPGGLLHVAIHLVGSLIVLVVVGTTTAVLLPILAVEAIVHYHLDWSKDNFVAARSLTPRDPVYWYATGVDQALHHLTYLGMALWWAVA